MQNIQDDQAQELSDQQSLISRSALLIVTIQKLSRTRSIDEIAEVVRHSARQLVNSDGATFVLREGNDCFYAAENAIGPLWTGKRFPLNTCIGGWVMNNKQQVAISEIYEDDRIPHEAYRSTFVKSLVMTPVRKEDPVASIGTYWSFNYEATDEDLEQLQILADSTSLAIENVNLYNELETRVVERTRQLHLANKELESFAQAVSHDLRTPLIGIANLLDIVMSGSTEPLPSGYRQYLEIIQAEAKRACTLVTDMLRLSKISHAEVCKESVDVSELAEKIFSRIEKDYSHPIKLRVKKAITADADPALLTIALENLLSNACKYSSRLSQASIEVGEVEEATTGEPDTKILYVRDNGAGFDMKYADNLFVVFKRLHTDSDFPGNGLGLATVQRVIDKHGGKVWAESTPGAGACFYLSLPTIRMRTPAYSID